MDSFDREPPFSRDAEQAILGAMLMDPESTVDAIGQLAPGMFYLEAHRRIFRAMTTLYERSEAIDPVTLCESLKATRELEAAGGWDYVTGLMGAAGYATNVDRWAGVIRDKALLRKLVEASTQSIRDVYEPEGRTAPEIIATAETRVLELGERSTTGYARAKALLWPTLEDIEARQAASGDAVVPGTETGLLDLDRMTLGLHGGELTVVAGRPSMGKTSLALGFALHASIAHEVPALVFSFEMSSTELMARALSYEGRVDLQALRGARALSQAEQQRMAAAAGHLNSAPLYIDDGSDTSIHSVAARTRRAVKSEGVQLVVLDYLQLMDAPGENRRLQIDKVTRTLKALARSLDLRVVLVSQLSRGPENRTDKRPILSDLRESGGVEQDADNVVMVYRPEYYMNPQQLKDAGGGSGLTELIVPKQRNGPTGTVRAVFHRAYTRFDSLARTRDDN